MLSSSGAPGCWFYSCWFVSFVEAGFSGYCFLQCLASCFLLGMLELHGSMPVCSCPALLVCYGMLACWCSLAFCNLGYG